MKRILISLVGMIVLVIMLLPLDQPASAVTGCAINITSDPGTGAMVYIYNTTDSTWQLNGVALESYNTSVPCGKCYEVWVEKTNVIYTVKNLGGSGASGWSGIGATKATGCLADNNQVNIHFEGTCDDGDPCTYDYCEDGACYHTYICGTSGGGLVDTSCYLWVDVLGEIYVIEMKCCPNESIYYHRCSDPDGLQFLEIEEDMEIICGDCAGACTDDPRDCTDCDICQAFPKVIVVSLADLVSPKEDGIRASVLSA